MKQPTPTLLIINLVLIIESKIDLWGLGNIFHFLYSLLVINYKRLDMGGCKRVLSGDKRLISDLGADYRVLK